MLDVEIDEDETARGRRRQESASRVFNRATDLVESHPSWGNGDDVESDYMLIVTDKRAKRCPINPA